MLVHFFGHAAKTGWLLLLASILGVVCFGALASFVVIISNDDAWYLSPLLLVASIIGIAVGLTIFISLQWGKPTRVKKFLDDKIRYLH